MPLCRTISSCFMMVVLICAVLAAQNQPASAGNQNVGASAQRSSSHASGRKTSAANAASSTAKSRRRSRSKPSDSPAPSPPIQPQVSYINGQLTVIANNSTLSDVLKAIQNTTGAKVEGVTPTDSDRVFGEFGPGSPREVCGKLLSGLHYDFILMGAAENPDSIQRIILTERSTELASSPSSPAPQPTQADDANGDQEMDAASNSQVEMPNQLQMTPEQQQILPPPADSAQSQPATNAQPSGQAPTRPQHWGVNQPRPEPTPPPNPEPPH